MSITARQIVLAQHPHGMPTDEDLPLREKTLDAPAQGEVLVRVIYLSLDPYMRGRMSQAKSYAAGVEIGQPITAESICEVADSKADGLSKGDIVLARTGWVDHAVIRGEDCRKIDPSLAPISTHLGVMGMPGFTAWVGLIVHGKVKSGDRVCVSSAAGAVGQIVGQIAKAKGATAIGIAGGPEKCQEVEETFGFDACVDYKTGDFKSSLESAAGDGFDIYFENVGGDVLFKVLPLMKEFGRVPLCGMIAWYNLTSAPEGPDMAPQIWRNILSKKLTVRGFINYDDIEHHDAFLQDMSGWLKDGTVKYREDIRDGLENAPAYFRDLLSGGNRGKMVVKVGEDPTE
ncbi:NADP-dependent oxidoreductase [Notoacmeibacter ruber]|uniref:NADP-dependent oxidoreductase n=1 Tax=Notoacmeibacter ruber TaxID=2670375 RepID=A0A3L7J9L4_9HYPH|nr:NADP-dependent oxidoreductase [Notoacmeibacter ruber]RLQ87055.1 NADP-dependent oxidoreductase [Notoacmeibacter ruber]